MPQHRRRVPVSLSVLAAASLAAAAPAVAQQEGREAPWTLAVSHAAGSAADLDGGGEVDVDRSALTLGWRTRTAGGTGLRLDLRYEQEDWHFSGASALGGAGWGDVRRARIGFSIQQPLGANWHWAVSPLLQYAGERGAETSDALIYGAALAFNRSFAADKMLGIGLVALHDIDETRLRPYLAVSWALGERWRIGNAAATGPAGPAGLELAFRADQRWDFGLGAGMREQRFRLDEDGPNAGGVGESRSLPVYARASLTAGPRLRLEAFAGTALRNRLRLEPGAGGERRSEDYDDSPVFGLGLSVGL